MRVDNVDLFAKNIRYLRELKGKKQGEVCAQLGFSTSAWSEYEHGWSKPRYNDLLKIIAYFEVTASELIEMDLQKGSPNDILELRKIVKKGSVKGSVSGSLNPEKSQNKDQVNKSKEVANPAVLKQLSRMEEEIKQLRSKLRQ